MAASRLPYRWAVVAYDRAYRFYHGLDTVEAAVGLALSVEVRRSGVTHRLGDGTVIGRGDRIGILHINNDCTVALHSDGLSPTAIGLEFRRRFLASLGALAGLAGPGGRLADVRAFAATTIFHHGLARLGFELEPAGLAWPRLVAAYQRALLSSLHPAGRGRVRRAAYQDAYRLWISRASLRRRYGSPVSRAI